MEKKTEQNGLTLYFDAEKTREYYANIKLCDCGGCRNYYAQARERFPGLTKWIEKFGVCIDRPDEIMYLDIEKNTNYLCVSYTVCGRLEGTLSTEISLTDCEVPSVTICSPDAPMGYIPNSQTGDYFIIDVTNFTLPWVLHEPMNG